MHDHNDNSKGGGHKGMMWMMVICCAIPLVFILVLGAGGKELGASTWVILGGVAVMVLAHFFMMGKSHKHSDGEAKNKDTKDKSKSGHGCCH